MRLEIRPKKLELKHPFTISRWTYTHMESMVVVVYDGEISGYGEATNNPYYENTGIDYELVLSEGDASFSQETIQFSEKIDADLVLVMTTRDIAFHGKACF